MTGACRCKRRVRRLSVVPSGERQMHTSIKQFASAKQFAWAIVVASMIGWLRFPASPAPGSPSPSASSAVAALVSRPRPRWQRAQSRDVGPTIDLDAGRVHSPAQFAPRRARYRPGTPPGSWSRRKSLRLDPRPGRASSLAAAGQKRRPLPGWPIEIKDSTRCGHPFPVDDGSVRIVCDARDSPRI